MAVLTGKGFDRLAPVYDDLARLVYGRSIVHAQRAYLNKIPPGAHVLILGGGTGWILSELFKVNPTCRVTYVEASAEMIRRSRQHGDGHMVNYIHTADLRFQGSDFDAVITNFFLDMFFTATVKRLITRLRNRLTPNGIWIVTEFQETGRPVHRFLLRTMYVFFRVFCRIEAYGLPDWTSAMKEEKFTLKESAHFYGSFIRSSVYIA